MSDKNYWRRRSLEYEKELSARCQSELETELAKYFKESLSEIEKDIAALYGRFARDNKLSYSDAKKLIRGAEFKEWRMSLQEYVALSHTNSKILRELNTLAMRSRISRLEKLYSDTLKELQNLGEKYDKVVGDFLRTAYTDRYTRGIHDLATVGKLEIPVAKVQPANLENVLAQRWAGGNYSTRIWKNTEHLSKVLKSTITQGLHRGLSVQKLSKSLSKEMGVSYKNAERLVRTELNFVSNMAARDSLIAAGLEEYEYIAAAGPRTCSICSNLNGTIHLLTEYSPGTNAPPMHPRCRCTISAVVESGKRTAKVAGKNIKVPADLSYRKWKKDVEREQAALQDAENLAKIRKAAALNGNILTGGLSQALPVKYVEAVIEQVKAAPENIRILWNLAQADMKILDINYQGTAHYSQEEKGIYFHLQQDISAILQKPYRTLFHEMGHLIDNWLEGFNGYCSVNFEGGLLGKTLKEEAEEYINALIKSRQLKNLSEAYYLISAELIVVPNPEQREVSDIWHGATNGKIHGRYGHNRKNYWTENQGENLPKEAFAHMFCSAIQNLEASIQIKKYFPNSYAIFEEIIRQCVKGA